MKNTKLTPRRQVIQHKHARLLFSSITALALSGLAAPSTWATTYTITNNTSAALDWNTPANWAPFAEAQYPGTAADDTAVVREAFNGNVTVNISATPANPLSGLTIGDTVGTGTTTIQASNASSLPLAAATITSSGAMGAANFISAPLKLSGGLTFSNATNNLTVSGKIAPSVAASQTIVNASTKTITLGDIELSTGSTADVVLTLSNATPTSLLVLGGTISNGGTVPAGLTLGTASGGKGANTSFRIDGVNTYTGPTTLVAGSPQPLTFYINSNQPFGTGQLNVSTASNAIATFEALNADRTIANANVTLQRASTYQGGNSLVFNGAVSAGSSHVINNNLTGTARLVFNGRYNTNSSNAFDGRLVTINGTGVTLFKGTIADSPVPTVEQFGTVNLGGDGTIILTGTATNQGDFRIAAGGTIQLGEGGTTGLIIPENNKKSVVTGGTLGTGFLAINHSDAITLSSTINGGIGLKQIGVGNLTIATPQFSTGANVVGDGINPAQLTLLAGAVNETTQVGEIAVAATKGPGYNIFRQIVTGINTSSLTVGQPVYVGATPSAAVYIHTIDSASQVALFGSGLLKASGGLPAGTATAIKFGAGSSLGSNAATTTIKNNATLSGTGTASGSVQGEGGSRFAPGVNTLDADGSKRLNFGASGTLTTGGLTLADNVNLDFDLASTSAGKSDLIVSSSLSFSSLNFTFSGLAGGTLQTDSPYRLVSVGAGSITGDTGRISSLFTGGLAGRYTATYTVTTTAEGNSLDVVFAAVSVVTPPPTVDEPERKAPRSTVPSVKRKWSVK